MKKMLFVLAGLFAMISGGAQNIESIKNLLVLQQYTKAKSDLDKGFSNPKISGKAEGHLLKATIYSYLSMEEQTKNTPEGAQLAADAEVAFQKYKEMDPAMSQLDDLIYQNAPINIYSFFYTSGYNDYNSKKWEAGYEKFKKAVNYSDMLIARQILKSSLDTNVLILAGVTAENAKKKDEAAAYYTRLADAKVFGDGFESVYRFLVNFYFEKKDYASFEKYKSIGGSLYPKSEFFTFDKIDFAVGLSEKLEDKIKAVDDVLATDPNNFKAHEALGEVLYEALNPRKDDQAIPENAAELEKRMISSLQKAASLEPTDELPNLYLGNHYMNKALKINEARAAHAADMKARTKPGTMASKEDLAKRDALDKQYAETMQLAKEPYEKAVAIYGAKPKLEPRDKQQYKNAIGYLADIATFNKAQSKSKPADLAKWTAEEKKWNDLYESIK